MRVLARGLMLAAILMTSQLLLAEPAHAATFTVNSVRDGADRNPDDSVCDTDIAAGDQCTLRAAIEQANFAPGADTIAFNIPDDPDMPGNEVRTISPISPLPTITDPVTIDGYTQGDATPDVSDDAKENSLAQGNNAVLLIELNENAPGEPTMLNIDASNTTVRGLVINDSGQGIFIFPDSTGNRIEGNFIGTDATGSIDRGNSSQGIFVLGRNQTIGGTSPGSRNVISGNALSGIHLGGGDLGGVATGNKVLGNYIGTNANGTEPLSNDGSGVLILGASDNTIGGAEPGAANIIAFNDRAGVQVETFRPIFEVIPTGNRILGNSIFENNDLGIDLLGGDEDPATGRTPNDRRDRDKGPNKLQNFPVLTSPATTSGGQITVKGKLNSIPNRSFTIQFFSNPPESQEEGKRFIGQKKVKTNDRGKASFTLVSSQPAPPTEFITATATDAGGNSSEFSVPAEVSQP